MGCRALGQRMRAFSILHGDTSARLNGAIGMADALKLSTTSLRPCGGNSDRGDFNAGRTTENQAAAIHGLDRLRAGGWTRVSRSN